jgi:hypothetical protein
MTKIIRAVTVAQLVGFYAPMVDGLRERGYEVVSVSSPNPICVTEKCVDFTAPIFPLIHIAGC